MITKGQTVTLRVNVGNLNLLNYNIQRGYTSAQSIRRLSQYYVLFSSQAYTFGVVYPNRVRWMREREKKTAEQLEAEGAGKEYLAVFSAATREIRCLANVFLSFGASSKIAGREVRFESTDGRRTMALAADNVTALIKQGEEFARGEDVFVLEEIPDFGTGESYLQVKKAQKALEGDDGAQSQTSSS